MTPTIQEFNRDMVRNFLEESGWRYLTDPDGDFQVQFGDDGTAGYELTVLFIVSGPEENLYSIKVLSNKLVPRSDWGRVLLLCNNWTREKRWPRAYLHSSNPDTDATAQIILDEHIDLGPGIHQELLDDWSQTVIWSAAEFWQEVQQKLNL